MIMNIHIHINTDNEAFTDNTPDEVSKILKSLAHWASIQGSIEVGDQRPAVDTNGNTVGWLKVE